MQAAINRIKKNFQAMPSQTRKAIHKFCLIYKKEGFECYLVGGSCRDLLLDEVPHDYDFATNCPLSVSKKLFRRVISVGESHGTLVVLFSGYRFEITRYRKDIKTDGRKAIIAYSDSIEEDQERRDLRLNALAYDVIEERLVDSQNGIADFEEKKIRFVGKAEERIKEDHLRALRYGRLIAKLMPLGFSYDHSEMEAVIGVFDTVALSIERIYDELNRTIEVGSSSKPFLLDYLPRLQIFNRYFADQKKADEAIRNIIQSESLLPFFYLYLEEHSLNDTCRNLRLSRNTKKQLQLVRDFSNCDLDDNIVIKSLLFKADHLKTEDLFEAFRVLLGRDISIKVSKIFARKEPYTLKHLQINGHDLAKLGLRNAEIGKALIQLLNMVWKVPSLNRKEKLMSIAADLKTSFS